MYLFCLCLCIQNVSVGKEIQRAIICEKNHNTAFFVGDHIELF